MIPSVAASCKNHPEREAIGICVKCRTRVCSECVTKVDGINYCVSCLARLAGEGKQADRESSRASEGWVAVLAAGGLILLLVLLMWGMVEAALPGSG